MILRFFSLILVCLISFSANLFATELYLLKADSPQSVDEDKYALILSGKGKDYGFIVYCKTQEQEDGILKALFKNPHPKPKAENIMTYSEFKSQKRMDATRFIPLCPSSDSKKNIDLFTDDSTYYLYLYKMTKEFLYLSVKSKKVVKAFNLEIENAQKVSEDYFENENVIVLDNGPEASSSYVDSKKEVIKIFIKNEGTVKADVVVTVHIKSESGKNDKTVLLDPLKDQYIFDRGLCISRADNGGFCKISVPYSNIINRIKKQLKDNFIIERIEDVSFENVSNIAGWKAANILREKENEKVKDKTKEPEKNPVPIEIKPDPKIFEIEKKLLQSNKSINTASKEIRIYPEIDDAVKTDIEVVIHLKSASGKNDKNIPLEIIKEKYIFDRQHYLCNKDTPFGCEIKIPYGEILNKIKYQLNDDFEVQDINSIAFKNIVIIDKKLISDIKVENPIVIPTPKPIVEPKVPKQTHLPESEDELREEKSRLYKEWINLPKSQIQKKSEIEERIALIDVALAEIHKKFKKPNEVKTEKPKTCVVRGYKFTDIDKAEKKKKEVHHISGGGNFAGAIVVGKCSLCDRTNEKSLEIGEHTIYSSQKRALLVPCSYCKDGKLIFHSPAFKKCWYRIKGKKANSQKFETEWRKCDRENTTTPINAYFCTDDTKDYFDEVVIETAPLE